MSRKILLSLLVGLIGFVFTFLTNYGHNLLGTSLIRGMFGFIVWFLLAFLLRLVVSFIMKQSGNSESLEENPGGEAIGAKLDITTPDEDEELINLLKQTPGEGGEGSGGFVPLQPPKLVTMKDPEELAKAVRHLKEE